MVKTVFVLHVFNRLAAVFLTKVNVEVRHVNTFRIQKTLKQQIKFNRVKVGNLQRPGGNGTRAGTAAGTNGHAVSFRPTDEVRYDQEVAGKTHFFNDAQLIIQTGVIFLVDFPPFLFGHALKINLSLHPFL